MQCDKCYLKIKIHVFRLLEVTLVNKWKFICAFISYCIFLYLNMFSKNFLITKKIVVEINFSLEILLFKLFDKVENTIVTLP